jgi:hypothetical protein
MDVTETSVIGGSDRLRGTTGSCDEAEGAAAASALIESEGNVARFDSTRVEGPTRALSPDFTLGKDATAGSSGATRTGTCIALSGVHAGSVSRARKSMSSRDSLRAEDAKASSSSVEGFAGSGAVGATSTNLEELKLTRGDGMMVFSASGVFAFNTPNGLLLRLSNS